MKWLWQSKHSLLEAIAVLRQEWTRHPYLSKEKKTTAQIEQDMKGEVLREKTEALGSDAYKILALIGQHVVADWWNGQMDDTTAPAGYCERKGA